MLDGFKRATWKSVELVNSQGKMDKRARAAMAPRGIVKQYLEECQRAQKQGLLLGILSEASLRLPGGKMLINLAGSSLERLREEDLCFTSLEKDYAYSGNQPAVHSELHRTIYVLFPDVNAVLLCHPENAVLCASRKILPNADELIDLKSFARGIQWLEKPEALIGEKITGAHSALVRGTGLFVWAKNLTEVVDHAAMIERMAKYSLIK